MTIFSSLFSYLYSILFARLLWLSVFLLRFEKLISTVFWIKFLLPSQNCCEKLLKQIKMFIKESRKRDKINQSFEDFTQIKLRHGTIKSQLQFGIIYLPFFLAISKENCFCVTSRSNSNMIIRKQQQTHENEIGYRLWRKCLCIRFNTFEE